MVTTKRDPACKLGQSKSIKPAYNNSNTTQRERILKRFAKYPTLTTMQARDEMGILHPPGRIGELRRLGYKIDTIMVYAADNNGATHNIGMYVFHGIDWSILEKRLIATHCLTNLSLDQRYASLKAELAKRHLTREQYDAEIKSLCKFLNY